MQPILFKTIIIAFFTFGWCFSPTKKPKADCILLLVGVVHQPKNLRPIA